MAIPPIHDAAVVSTSNAEGATLMARARDVASRCRLPFARRRHLSPGVPALILEAGGAHLELSDAVVRSHPGMGLVRVRRLIRGEEHDPIVDIGELRAGDAVLDATFGYGQDALVAAWAVGEPGRVVGVEASPLLAGLALAGAPFWPAPGAELMKRVEIRCEDMRRVLQQAGPASFDRAASAGSEINPDDQVGVLVGIGNDHLRLDLPSPGTQESDFDTIELVR